MPIDQSVIDAYAAQRESPPVLALKHFFLRGRAFGFSATLHKTINKDEGLAIANAACLLLHFGLGMETQSPDEMESLSKDSALYQDAVLLVANSCPAMADLA